MAIINEISVNEKDKDLKLKKTNKKSSLTNVLLHKPRLHDSKSRLRKIFDVLVDTFYEYLENTKVNGTYYIRRLVTRGWLRILWSTIIILYFSFGATLIFLLYQRYSDSPVRTVLKPPKSLMEIPFPAVTVCHPQSVMDYKVTSFVERIKYPLGATKEKISDIIKYLGIFTEYQWVYPSLSDLEMIDELLDLNNMTINDGIMELGSTCEDFILVCYFAGKKFPCFDKVNNNSQITWVSSMSFLGACCSFNYFPSFVDIDPIYTPFFSLNGGLSVIGTGRPQASDGKSGALYSEGFVSIIHHPDDYAVETATNVLVGLGKETFIDVTPISSTSDEKVLALPFKQRSCINPQDPEFLEYRQPACMLDCLKEKIYEKCKCHPFHLPRQASSNKQKISNIRDCKVIDAICFVENYFYFKKLDCECFPSCSDIYYKSSSFSTEFEKFEYSINNLYFETNLTKQEFIIRVYFGNQSVMSYEKIVVMSWISLLSNLGGTFSLCLGVSLISIAEIFFYLTFRIVRHFRRSFQVGPPAPRVRF